MMMHWFMQAYKGLVMKIRHKISVHSRGTYIDTTDEQDELEKMERQALLQRIKTMDMEIDNIGRRKQQGR